MIEYQLHDFWMRKKNKIHKTIAYTYIYIIITTNDTLACKGQVNKTWKLG